MSKSKLELYKENFRNLVDAFADMHNAHCKFLKKPSRAQRVDLRLKSMKVKKIVGAIPADIGHVYREDIATRRTVWTETQQKQSKRTKASTTNQQNGENNVEKDI